MSDLSDNLLQQILDAQSEMNATLGRHGAEINALRVELVGPSGKNGRLGKIEGDVEKLKAEKERVIGAKAVVTWLITLATSVGTFLGMKHFYK
jgi:hypothetical protein